MIRILILLLFSVPVLAQPNVSQWSEVAPVPEPIPDGKVITVAPNDNVKRIIETASNATVRFLPGTFELGPIFVPVGVNLDLGSSLVVATQPGGFNQVQAVFWFKSSRAEGNQTISGGTIDGRNIAAGGIIIDGRDKVQISGTKFRSFNFVGLWILNSSNGEAKDLEFFNTSAATNSWASGELSFFNLSNWDIHHVKVSSNSPNKGYGLKAMYNKGTLTNVRFYNITTRMNVNSIWNGGQSKNIGLEIENTRIVGTVEIFNCDFGNQISLALGPLGNGKVIVRNNTGNLSGSTYFVETVGHNIEIRDNRVQGVGIFAANFQKNGTWSNLQIYNNELFNAPGTPDWAGLILVGADGVTNSRLGPNQFPEGRKLIHYMGRTGGFTIVGSNQ